MFWRPLPLLFAAALSFGLSAPASAQTSRQCQHYAAQLQQIERSGAPVDSLSDALIRQRQALARGLSDYQRTCQQVSLFGGVSPRCPSLQARVEEMQENLARLEARTRRGRGSIGASPADRARILAAMRQAGCDGGGPPDTIRAAAGRPAVNGPAPIAAGPSAQGRTFTLSGPNGPVTYREDDTGRITRADPVYAQPQRVAVAPPPPTRTQPQGGLFGALFGAPPSRAAGRDPYARPGEPGADRSEGELVDGEPVEAEDRGAYRTICVRMCDGYYFPISYSVGRSRFGTDSEICRARCPSADTRLFAHPTGSDSETAVSADDVAQPYTKIPNALRYRTEYVSGCGCGRPDPTLLPVNASSEEGASSSSSTVKVGDLRDDLPLPRAKPEPDEDPDTRANALSGFVPAPFDPRPAETARSGAPTGPRQVRTVGPKFFATR